MNTIKSRRETAQLRLSDKAKAIVQRLEEQLDETLAQLKTANRLGHDAEADDLWRLAGDLQDQLYLRTHPNPAPLCFRSLP